MGSSMYPLVSVGSLFFLSMFHFLSSLSSFSTQPLCNDFESFALLQFKQSFKIDVSASYDPSGNPKISLWKSGERNDCCSWDGVACDRVTGHVIGLDLSSCQLYGSINSSSSLFHLLHLQMLNLADNDFNYSQIPPSIRYLSNLTYLNLSMSKFSGQIPPEIFELSKLVSLDLSFNPLKLQKPSLKSFVEKLTSLKLLYLDEVNISSLVPHILSNFSSLTSLGLRSCALHGEFPIEIFKLRNLQFLSMEDNEFLTGYLPEFESGSPLQTLGLADTGFSGKLPDSIGNLTSLTVLDLDRCRLSGEFPIEIFKLPNLQVLCVKDNHNLTGYLPEFHTNSSLQILRLAKTGFLGKLPDSIGNLNSLYELDIHTCHFSGLAPTSLGNLTNLIHLDLSYNAFSPQTFTWLGKQTKLTHLFLERVNFYGVIPSSLKNMTKLASLNFAENQLTGQIPFSLANLTQLRQLDLSYNAFTPQTFTWLGKQTKLTHLFLECVSLYGVIPSSLKNMTKLASLSFAENQLTGQIPSWLVNLTDLTKLYLEDNSFSGTVNFGLFSKLKNLIDLQLSDVHLSFPNNSTHDASIPKLKLLGLVACNLTKIPNFLRFQNELEVVYLSYNKIQGQIPNWIFDMGKETLLLLALDFNFITGFESNNSPLVLPWGSLLIFGLSSNKMQGPLPVPPPSIIDFKARNNKFTGKISPLFCNLSSIETLVLSHNHLSGMLPQCFSNLSAFLLILDLRNNNFHGTFPASYMEGCRLKLIDVSYNKLKGQVPRSLSNCKMLDILLLGNNRFSDIFPSWLGKLPMLRALSLRSNDFHGAIGKPESIHEFPKLQIIDVSYNNLTGRLPSEYFRIWDSMKVSNSHHLSYMNAFTRTIARHFIWDESFNYSMVMTNKGVQTVYEKIQGFLIVIDLSSNRFEGEISNVIVNLKGLHLLNLSNNILTGHIPSSLGNLIELESLDLSQNKLSGEIPQQLLQLTFLAFFNVSNNHLKGSIPQGQQFSTFLNDSYMGNTCLCGSPLTKKCKIPEKPTHPPPLSKHGEGSYFPSKFDWVVIMMGYGSGLVIGFVIGHNMTIRKFEQFVKNLRRRR